MGTLAKPRVGVGYSAEMRKAHALFADGRGDALKLAAVHLRNAARMAPERPEPLNDLGVLLARMGHPAEALACYRQSLGRDPEHAPAHSNAGALFRAQGLYAEAAKHLEEALRISPGFADAHTNLAATLNNLGRFAEAAHHAERALALRPGDLESMLNLGNAHHQRGRYLDAAACYRQATEVVPGDARPLNNLAETLRDLGDIAGADAAYRAALERDPGHAVTWSNLLYLHAFAHDLRAEEELKLARGWERAVVRGERREESVASAARRPGAEAPFSLPVGDRGLKAAATPAGELAPAAVHAGVLRSAQDDDENQATTKTNAGSSAALRNDKGEVLRHDNERGRRLRLGIVSAELGTHAVAEFLQPFLEHLDRERFHVTLVPTVGRTDARARAILAMADEVLPIAGITDEAACGLIRGRGMDVLLDTSGHTTGNRLGVFARRAAPVQCTWIGYWGTTGLTEMDYAIADPIAPVGAEAGFSEELWRLPRINVCYRGDETLPTDWEPATDGTIRLGSLNKFAKMREETFALWAGALHALPEARLVLEDRGAEDGDSHRRIREGFARLGIAEERVEFVPYVPGHERHMRLYNEIDVALDTVPFNSGTTAFDALWMGVPLVTVEGDWNGGRIAAGVLRAMGRGEWVAADAVSFASVVRDLARDVNGRREMRATQRERMLASELCDAAGLAREMEKALVGMVERRNER